MTADERRLLLVLSETVRRLIENPVAVTSGRDLRAAYRSVIAGRPVEAVDAASGTVDADAAPKPPTALPAACKDVWR